MAYSPEKKRELLDFVYSELRTGKSVRQVMRENKGKQGFPDADTFDRWFVESEDEYDQYARAIERGIDESVDEMLEIAEDEAIEINRAKLMIDVIKWSASKRYRKKYGETITTEIQNQQPKQLVIIRPADASASDAEEK